MSKQHITSYASQIFGRFANKEFSKFFQSIINNGYVKIMGVDMSEFEAPSSYSTLNKLFIRELKNPREINPKYSLISPVDALISDCGKIKDGYAYQIKGMEYKLNELLGKQYTGFDKLLEGGEFINFYLSPRDYHRYHIPMDLDVLSISHIPGKLYPVNNRYLTKKKNLFIENERVVIKVKDRKDNIHFLVLVGALNVGQMVVLFEENITTNIKLNEESYYEYSDLKLKISELFGYFKMGSTIVTLSQKDAIIPDVRVGQNVKFGDRIGGLL